MGKHDTTAAIVDGLLKIAVGGGVVATVLIIPNAAQALDKPLKYFLNTLDGRARDREMRRISVYMKKRGLVTGDYEHGLIITKLGRDRAKKVEFDQMNIQPPKKWDNKWRIVMFDIPESHKVRRNSLTQKLKQLGFKQLQRSVWIHPFSCRMEIERTCLAYGVSKYVTYIETTHIDHQDKLITRFTPVLHRHI